jgi:hypothetical protein
MESGLSHQFVGEVTLLGMGLDALGGCYLAYDLFGGRGGPLRTISRTAGYVALFFIGYAVALGFGYALVAATGMGTLLASESRLAGISPLQNRAGRATLRMFGFLRGLVLGLAGITVAGPLFGACFGIFSGLALMIAYSLGYAPAQGYKVGARPELTRATVMAAIIRGLLISACGTLADFLASTTPEWPWLGLRVGVAAGIAGALALFFSPRLEWWTESLPERQLGMFGIGLIFCGMVLESIPNWLMVWDVHVY